MNENELYVVKENKFDNPLITKIDSIIDNCYRDCHNKDFHTFKYVCIYDIKLTNITNNEIIYTTISDESMNLFELIKKLKLARQRGFILNQINKLTIKIFSHQRYINVSYYLKHGIPIMHRQFLKYFLEIVILYKHIVMIEKIVFTLHVRHGLKIVRNFIIYEPPAR